MCEGEHVVRFLLRLVTKVVIPRPSDRLMNVSVSRGVQDLGQRHPDTPQVDRDQRQAQASNTT